MSKINNIARGVFYKPGHKPTPYDIGALADEGTVYFRGSRFIIDSGAQFNFTGDGYFLSYDEDTVTFNIGTADWTKGFNFRLKSDSIANFKVNGYKIYHEGSRPTWSDVGGDNYWTNTLAPNGITSVIKSTNRWISCQSGLGYLPHDEATGSAATDYLGTSAWWFKEAWVHEYRGDTIDVGTIKIQTKPLGDLFLGIDSYSNGSKLVAQNYDTGWKPTTGHLHVNSSGSGSYSPEGGTYCDYITWGHRGGATWFHALYIPHAGDRAGKLCFASSANDPNTNLSPQQVYTSLHRPTFRDIEANEDSLLVNKLNLKSKDVTLDDIFNAIAERLDEQGRKMQAMEVHHNTAISNLQIRVEALEKAARKQEELIDRMEKLLRSAE